MYFRLSFRSLPSLLLHLHSVYVCLGLLACYVIILHLELFYYIKGWCKTTVDRLFHWSSWNLSTKNMKVNATCWECTTCFLLMLASSVFCHRTLENISINGSGKRYTEIANKTSCYFSSYIFIVKEKRGGQCKLCLAALCIMW